MIGYRWDPSGGKSSTANACGFPSFAAQFATQSNRHQRINREVRRSSNVVGIFANDAAIVRPVGALLFEQNDQSAIERHYMSLETLAGMSDNHRLGLLAIAA